jgi:malonyl-CoA/methylmalonyl-CoA synthetase
VSQSVAHAFAELAAQPAIADRPAIIAADATLTYRAFARHVARVAGTLAEAGIGRGDVVAMLAEPGAAYAAGLFGTLHAGASHAPLQPSANEAELRERIELARPRAVLASKPMYSRALSAVDAIREESTARDVRIIDLEAAASGTPRLAADVGPNDIALVLFTSGSTGIPKAIALAHRNILGNAYGVSARTGITPHDRLLHLMPLFHTNGINNQLIAPLLSGASVVLRGRFVADHFFETVERDQPTYVTGVPTMFVRLLDRRPPASTTLRFLRCGSGPLARELQEEVEAHFGLPLVTSYGLTEATCTSTMNPPTARRLGTVGPALDGQEIAILALETDDAVATGNLGEVAIRGCNVMPSVNGWLRTGDIGFLDPDGHLTLTDRVKDIIVRGGENLSPQQIERTLRLHPAVADCAVFGVPNREYGEVPDAAVVFRDGLACDGDALRAHVAEHLSWAHVPETIVTVPALPVTPVGKVDRGALRAMVVA